MFENNVGTLSPFLPYVWGPFLAPIWIFGVLGPSGVLSSGVGGVGAGHWGCWCCWSWDTRGTAALSWRLCPFWEVVLISHSSWATRATWVSTPEVWTAYASL